MSYDLIAAKLDEIEAEMHRIGYWFDNPPTPVSCRFEDIAGEMRRVGYWDAADPNRNGYGRVVSPPFVLHLQKIFLPWARQRVQETSLPPNTNIGILEIRQYDYHSIVPVAQPLLRLLCQFDGWSEASMTISHDRRQPVRPLVRPISNPEGGRPCAGTARRRTREIPVRRTYGPANGWGVHGTRCKLVNEAKSRRCGEVSASQGVVAYALR